MLNLYYSCIQRTHLFYLQAESFVKLHKKLISVISTIAVGVLSGLAGKSISRLNPDLKIVFYAISFSSIIYVINLLFPAKYQIRDRNDFDSSTLGSSSIDYTDSYSSSDSDSVNGSWTEFDD